ncbi:MAG: hypothetical protein ACE366_10035 [Bradymonadia bacterium]
MLHRPRALTLCAALLGAAAVGHAPTAEATTVLELELADLVQRSALIITGNVAEIVAHDAKMPDGKGQIRTTVRIEVDEVLKGQWAEPVFTLDQPGGVVGAGTARREMHVPGVAAFKDQQEVLVFLEQTPGGRWVVTGMAQGLYTLEPGADGPVARRSVGDLNRVPQRHHDVLRFDGVPQQSDALKLDALKGILARSGPRVLQPGVQRIDPDQQKAIRRIR